MAYKKIELEFADVPFAFMITENVEIELVFSGIAVVVADDEESALKSTKGVKFTQDYQHDPKNDQLENWTELPENTCISEEFSKIKGFKDFWEDFEISMIEAAANYENDET
jgi:hypothetical protein